MSLIQNGAGESAKNFYNGVATQSLRFDKPSDPRLFRTPDAGNTRTWTWSGWIKQSEENPGGDWTLFGQGSTQIIIYQRRLWVNIRPAGTSYYLVLNRLVTDITAWMHVVVAYDSTQSTAANRIKWYVNGVHDQVYLADYDAAGGGTGSNFEGSVNTAAVHNIGCVSDGSGHYDGYMSEMNFTDGVANDADAFGETKGGVWIPKEYEGSYGQNGFRLQFDQVGVGSASTSTIGADTSGQNNHWTSGGIVTTDCNMPDSPENNFNMLNPLQMSNNDSNFFLSEGDLKLTATNNSGYRNCSTTFSPMGFKGYFEFVTLTAINHKIGIIADTTHPDNQDYGNSGPQHVTLEYNGEVKFPNNGTSHRSASDHNLGTIATGDVMALAFDFTGTNRNVWFARANTYGTASGGVGNPATGANPIVTASNLNLTGDYRFHIGANNGPRIHFNFGQDGTFQGTETAGGNTDGNGIGNFYYEPPAGFLAMCSSNLPEPDIGPNSDTQATEHFNTVIWTAQSVDGATKTITVGFKPDFIWGKPRNRAADHMLTNSIVGFNKYLRSNGNNAEAALDSFVNNAVTATGYLLDDDEDGYFNYAPDGGTADNMVSWNWKANGGTATATISESGNNPAAVVQANPTAGFSLITYTGTGANGTIAHGLGAVPTMMIIKNRLVADAWAIYQCANTAAPATDYLVLNTTAATVDAATYWADTAPTSSVFTVSTVDNVNADGESYVAYVFADVAGYSKMGTYIGSGAADDIGGAYVHTGFSPAFVMVKRTDSTNNWVINDSIRTPTNTITGGASTAYADSTSIEANLSTDVDFLSNGFKAKTTGGHRNASGAVYIYMAFAVAPFKYANSR